MPAPDAWHYSGDPTASTLDEVRFLCQDTDPAVRLLADAEISYVITVWIGALTGDGVWDGPYDHPLMAAHGCALRIAAKFAAVTTIDADGVEVDLSALQEKYRTLATDLRNEYERLTETGADVDYANLLIGTTFDLDIEPLDFAIGMHDNPAAGQQEYGGQSNSGVDLAEFESSP